MRLAELLSFCFSQFGHFEIGNGEARFFDHIDDLPHLHVGVRSD